MDLERGEDLGRGVYVSPGTDGEVSVVSPRLDLGWRAADGQVPGTSVLWREKPYEVVGRAGVAQGARWTLQVWRETSAMRGVFRLDRESIREIADRAEAEARGRRTRKSTVLLLPLIGLAPAKLQKKWADDWGLNAERATQISAVCEVLFGALGIIQVAANAFGGELFMPIWLAYPGVLIFASGVVRLALVAADGEPVGSPLGLPLLLVVPKPTPTIERTTPAVRSFDEGSRMLVLESPILRRDWDRDGLLRYRGGLFRLERTEQEGRFWVYHFERNAHGGEEERILQLRPPVAPPLPSAVGESTAPSFLRTALITAVVTLGPAADQERWAAEQGIKAVWLTIAGAGAELIGGIANLQNDLGHSFFPFVLLDFYLLGEGLLRLGSALVGRPMGSIFGWMLRPLYRKYLPPETGNQ